MQLSIRDGDSWTKRTARNGFPILVEYARDRREITYGGWNDEIVRRGLGSHYPARLYGLPAGEIGKACEEYARATGTSVPPINLMVVNKETRLPGNGAHNYFIRFCSDYLERDVRPDQLSTSERRALIEHAQKEIFDFPSWGDVLTACGLTETTALPSKPKRRQPQKTGWNTGPESEQHKCLKRLVADNPAWVGLKAEKKGEQEHPLWSGDRIDVYFERVAVGIEVKAADAGFDEIHRGIFQCVKYKAVMQAQQIHDRQIPTADCLLALGGALPKELREVADLLKVCCYDRLAQ